MYVCIYQYPYPYLPIHININLMSITCAGLELRGVVRSAIKDVRLHLGSIYLYLYLRIYIYPDLAIYIGIYIAKCVLF